MLVLLFTYIHSCLPRGKKKDFQIFFLHVNEGKKVQNNINNMLRERMEGK